MTILKYQWRWIMTTMAISVFKAHALEAIGRVCSSKERIVITKRGVPVAQVMPYQSLAAKRAPGRLADSLVYEKDLIAPLEEELWEANR
jgi:prevent-host-death family protein